jgi:hypothetical protein
VAKRLAGVLLNELNKLKSDKNPVFLYQQDMSDDTDENLTSLLMHRSSRQMRHSMAQLGSLLLIVA